jgi:hypothetical protein
MVATTLALRMDRRAEIKPRTTIAVHGFRSSLACVANFAHSGTKFAGF